MLKKLFLNSFTWYLIVIFIFSFIYYVAFKNNTDCFIVHNQLNKHPVWEITQRTVKALEEGTSDAFLDVQNFITESKKSDDPFEVTIDLIRQYNEINSKIKELRQYRAELIKAKETLGKKIDAKREVNEKKFEEEFKQTELAPLERKVVAIKKTIEKLKKSAEGAWANGEPKKASEIYVEVKEKIAERWDVENLISEKTIFMLDSLIGGRASGVKKELKRWNEMRQQEWLYQDEIRKLESAQEKLFIDYKGGQSKLAQRMAGRVGYIDFLYFSIGISATITFGDLIPNTPIIRMIVMFQLLVCLFVVAKLLNGLINRGESSKNESKA